MCTVGNIVCERAGAVPQVFGGAGVRFGKWISHLTAQSSPHGRGNAGAAEERPEDGYNLITTNTRSLLPRSHTRHTPIRQNIKDALLTLQTLRPLFAHLISYTSPLTCLRLYSMYNIYRLHSVACSSLKL